MSARQIIHIYPTPHLLPLFCILSISAPSFTPSLPSLSLSCHLRGRASSLSALLPPFPQSPRIAPGQTNTSQPPAATPMLCWNCGRTNAHTCTVIVARSTQSKSEGLLWWCYGQREEEYAKSARMRSDKQVCRWTECGIKLECVSCPAFRHYGTPGSGKGQGGLPQTLQIRNTICSRNFVPP